MNLDTSKLTPEARITLSDVKRPQSSKPQVDYRADFLDNYIPNITRYLSPSQCKMLATEGKLNGNDSKMLSREEINCRLLIDLSWSSSSMEGSTYSRLETERLILEGKSSCNKAAKEAKMILNHKEAILLLTEGGNLVDTNAYTIRGIHSILSDGFIQNPNSRGNLRTIPVDIEGTSYTPTPIPQLVDKHFNDTLSKASTITDPFEKAFFLLVHLPYLQPFEDGNKRTSRLAANIPLLQNNLCPISFVGVDSSLYTLGLLGVYELNKVDLLRDVFLQAYENSLAQYSSIKSKT